MGRPTCPEKPGFNSQPRCHIVSWVHKWQSFYTLHLVFCSSQQETRDSHIIPCLLMSSPLRLNITIHSLFCPELCPCHWQLWKYLCALRNSWTIISRISLSDFFEFPLSLLCWLHLCCCDEIPRQRNPREKVRILVYSSRTSTAHLGKESMAAEHETCPSCLHQLGRTERKLKVGPC